MTGMPLVGQYDPWMVLASLLIAIAAGYTALDLASRLAVTEGSLRALWLGAGSVAMGTGIWSMHFVAMLGYHLPIPVAYDVPLVLLSIIEAIAASAIALRVVSRPRFDWRLAAVAALCMGTAIVAMHYTGMAALRMDARLQYDRVLVLASCAIAVVASGAAMWLAFHLRDERSRVSLYRLVAAIVMGLAITGMHYTGMAALRLVGSGTHGAADAPHAVPGAMLGSATVVGTLFILVATLLVTWMDRRRRSASASGLRVPPGLLWTSLGMSVVAVLAVVTLNWRTTRQLRRADDAMQALASRVSDLRYLDEALTMSAYAGALSGDPSWNLRYDTLDTRISALLSSMGRDVPTVDGTRGGPALVAENERLMQMEREAIARSANPQRGDAHLILQSPAYLASKRRFAAVLASLTDSITAREAAVRREQDSAAALGLILAAGTLLLIGVAWAGILATLRTALSRTTAQSLELAAAKSLAEAANRSKSEFLANMSHELRTPLSAVIGFANILSKDKGGRLTAVDLQYVDRIRKGGVHLLGLINEILDLARVESGHSEMEMAPVDLGTMVRDAAALVDTRLESRNVRIVLDLPQKPITVMTDGARVTQVLLNLMGNAIKFTEQGSVTVRARADSPTSHATIEVSDTGTGIPADRLDAIFNPFEQADSGTSRKFGGTGLGLAISRAIATGLGGTLTARSEMGVGSTFTLTLPASADSLASPRPGST